MFLDIKWDKKKDSGPSGSTYSSHLICFKFLSVYNLYLLVSLPYFLLPFKCPRSSLGLRNQKSDYHAQVTRHQIFYQATQNQSTC